MKSINKIKEKIKDIFATNGIIHEWWVQDDGNVVVEVIWGDWRNDHMALDHVMTENNFALIERIITEEDGTDAYSAEYVFRCES